MAVVFKIFLIWLGIRIIMGEDAAFYSILIPLILIIVFMIFAEPIQNNKQKLKKIIESTLNNLSNFKSTQQVMDVNLEFGLAIDEEQNKICLLKITKGASEQPNISTKIIPYKDILSVELFQNGTSIKKTVRSSQIGGAVVGGLLLGGAGAVIGGLSGKTETTGKVNHIALLLTVNDVKNPLHGIVFLNKEEAESIYKKQLQLARHWHGIIKIIIKGADEEEKKKLQVIKREKPIIASKYFIADEIKKLADLHNSGALTLEEFQQQKAKLLGVADTPKQIEPKSKKLETKVCTKCNIPMQIKTVTKGEQQGKQFYVCSNYPTCREVYKIETYN